MATESSDALQKEIKESVKRQRLDISNEAKGNQKHDLSAERESHGSGPETFGNTVASHYNRIEEKGLEERNLSRIVYLRNFNNWIKSVLINKFLDEIWRQSHDGRNIVALDIGCGKGGDLLKWQKGRIHHLICADIADISIKQCSQRYEDMKRRGNIFSAEFITTDCSKSRLKHLISPANRKVDIVSSQFVIHYAFESLSQAETMVRNAAETLKDGGYFIATFPDACKIRSLIDSSSSGGFTNEVFRIIFPNDRSEPPPLFGDKYMFYLEGVVDCPEFLVHFPTLVRICKKYGLELAYKKRFEDVYKDGMTHRESRSLLFRMRALELYPPSRDNSHLSSKNEEEYSHGRQYMAENNVSCVKTMTKSEWEAASVYLAAAFKKVASD